MPSNAFSIEEGSLHNFEVKIKVIGVGGGGGNMINHIVREGIHRLSGMDKVELLAANTDAQVLKKSSAYTLIQLGEKKARGMGAGAKPEIGREAAEESTDEIRAALSGADIVFIAAGFGGGTGTGAAPVIARVAKEIGALAVAVVTTPFKMELKKRMTTALEGIKELRKECDSIIVVPNEKLLGIIGRNVGYKSAFKIVDAVLADAVSGMSSVILNDGDSDINVDFHDVKTAMSHKGQSLLSVGYASASESAAVEAVKTAIQSPLLEDVNIKGAKGLLLNFRFHPEHPFEDISKAVEFAGEAVGDDGDVDLFFGTLTDSNIEQGSVQVTMIATGIQEQEQERVEVKPVVKQPIKTGTDDNLFGDWINSSSYKIMPRPTEDELDKPAIYRKRMD